MKNRTLMILALITSVNLVACSELNLNIDKADVYLAPSFEVDKLTVRQNNEWNIRQELEIDDNDSVPTEQDIKVDVGEVQLDNNDNSVDYQVEGEDIIYNGVRYKGLYTAINSVTYPYDTNTFINFITKIN